MNLGDIMLSEISQAKTNTYALTYMWNLKKKKRKARHIETEDRLVIARGGASEEDG